MKFSTRVARKRDTSCAIKIARHTTPKNPATAKAMNRPMRGEALRATPSSTAGLWLTVVALVAGALVAAAFVAAAVVAAALVTTRLVAATLVAGGGLVPASEAPEAAAPSRIVPKSPWMHTASPIPSTRYRASLTFGFIVGVTT